METELELNDIQGIIRRGYGDLKFAYFLLLKITKPHEAKVWLGKLDGEIRDGTTKPTIEETCVNIAFTQAGFKKLGLVEQFLENQQFSIEFEDGMNTKHRRDILGDYGSSAPDNWDWGGSKNNPHIILLLHAGSQTALDKLCEGQREKFEGLEEICKENGEPFLDALELPDRKEHFGYRDGISQPRIAGLVDKEESKNDKDRSQTVLKDGGSDGNIIAAGEFILGYKNVYSKYPDSPKVKAGDGELDFGRNGSYLVFRQLSQNVYKFWQHIDSVAKSDATERDKLGAKMVGRWRSGAPIVLNPDVDPNDPEKKNDDNFNYYDDDKYGYKCPVASHLRRANPRDSKEAEEGKPEDALRDANKHRIIRRGRPYGEPIAKSMDPKDILAAGDTGKKVGLQFLCFNANIGRQFEFVQHTWVNSSKFDGLYSSSDPLLGPIPDDKNATSTQRAIFGNFVEPAEPLRRRVSDMQRYINVVGGAYFFMPGINAIKYLAKMPET